MKRRILVATTNPGKVTELNACLDADIEWLNLSDFDNLSEIEEDGSTFAENARKKALGYAKAAGYWTIADDSGLLVNALDGAPGVKSSRFSGDKEKGLDRTLIDRRNIEKVLELLKDVPKEKRTAKFVCCLCLASPEKVLIETQGTLKGLIAESPIGESGFGYDPLFFVPDEGCSAAELPAHLKNRLSHRGQALQKLLRNVHEITSTP